MTRDVEAARHIRALIELLEEVNDHSASDEYAILDWPNAAVEEARSFIQGEPVPATYLERATGTAALSVAIARTISEDQGVSMTGAGVDTNEWRRGAPAALTPFAPKETPEVSAQIDAMAARVFNAEQRNTSIKTEAMQIVLSAPIVPDLDACQAPGEVRVFALRYRQWFAEATERLKGR
jgi:hypothetical protein